MNGIGQFALARLNIPQSTPFKKQENGWYEYDYDYDYEKRERTCKSREDFLCCRLDFLCFVFIVVTSYSFIHSFMFVRFACITKLNTALLCLCHTIIPQLSILTRSLSLSHHLLISSFSFFLMRIFSVFFTLNFLSRRLIHCMNRIFPN